MLSKEVDNLLSDSITICFVVKHLCGDVFRETFSALFLSSVHSEAVDFLKDPKVPIFSM